VSEDECRAVEAAARQFGRTVGVNHNVTFEATYQRLIDVIRARRIGAVQHVAVYWNVPYGDNTFDQPMYKRIGAAAHMLETGPHPLSLLVRLIGEAKHAAALPSSVLRADDTWQIALECERGTGQCFIGIARPFPETRVRVIGEDGMVEADLRLGNVAVVENTASSPLFFKLNDTLGLARSLASSALRNFAALTRRIPAGGAVDDFSPMMRASMANFYEALRAGRAPKADLNEGLAVVRTCLRAIEAARDTRATQATTVQEETTWQSATASS
jgi:predicted dehydrogenase